MSCSLIDLYRPFELQYYLHFHGRRVNAKRTFQSLVIYLVSSKFQLAWHRQTVVMISEKLRIVLLRVTRVNATSSSVSRHGSRYPPGSWVWGCMDLIADLDVVATKKQSIPLPGVDLRLPGQYPHSISMGHVCMYKGWAMKSGPCTATFSDLLCFPF
jgi:hypothetical protein